jgi:hypothetical protein
VSDAGYTRCTPHTKLALCHFCYRYMVKRIDGRMCNDHYEECKTSTYSMYYDWRKIAYGNKYNPYEEEHGQCKAPQALHINRS